jgi:hypothetical protein
LFIPLISLFLLPSFLFLILSISLFLFRRLSSFYSANFPLVTLLISPFISPISLFLFRGFPSLDFAKFLCFSGQVPLFDQRADRDIFKKEDAVDCGFSLCARQCPTDWNGIWFPDCQTNSMSRRGLSAFWGLRWIFIIPSCPVTHSEGCWFTSLLAASIG